MSGPLFLRNNKSNADIAENIMPTHMKNVLNGIKVKKKKYKAVIAATIIMLPKRTILVLADCFITIVSFEKSNFGTSKLTVMPNKAKKQQKERQRNKAGIRLNKDREKVMIEEIKRRSIGIIVTANCVETLATNIERGATGASFSIHKRSPSKEIETAVIMHIVVVEIAISAIPAGMYGLISGIKVSTSSISVLKKGIATLKRKSITAPTPEFKRYIGVPKNFFISFLNNAINAEEAVRDFIL
jgi:hypothetical protein